MSVSLSVAPPALPGDAEAQAIAAIFKAADDLFTILNSPTALALRQRQDIQAILQKWDQDAQNAHKTGDLTTVNQESSG
jgi:hypothetical protein